jgi:transglutaminase-like putative cysteine protease
MAVLLPVLVASGVLRPLTGDRPPADPRSLVTRPPDVQARISPLSRIKAQLLIDPPTALFMVDRVGPAALGDRIRTATLDTYDGVTWRNDLSYPAAGHRFFPEPGVAGAHDVTARITIDRLEGPFVPAVGYPVRLVDLAPGTRRLGYNRDSGGIVDRDGLRRGFTYQVTGRVRDRDAGLAAAAPPSAAAMQRYILLPTDVPAEIRLASERLAAPGGSRLAKLTAIELHLRSLPYDLGVPSILNLLGSGPARRRGGSAEQHAAAFAVLARLAGVPTRVAVGYRLASGPGPHGVTTRQAHAWPESFFPGYGWLAFEPTDTGRAPEPRPSPQAGFDAQPPPPSARPHIVPQPAPRLSRPQARPSGAVRTASWRHLWWASLVPVVVLVLVLGRKRQRRWSRRRGGLPSDRVRGAWREAMDRLAERGFRERAGDTPGATAGRAGAAFEGTREPLSALASLVTGATFSGVPPTGPEVTRAWRCEREVRRALHPGRSVLVRRPLALVDPRPLWRLRQRDRSARRGAG